MKHLILLLAFLLTLLAHAEEKKTQDLFQLTCFNVKLDSSSKCSSTTSIHRDHPPETIKGGLTCGYPKLTSKIEWKLKEMEGDELTILISRVFPLGEPDATVSQKEVTYAGERIIVFEDSHQVIVIEPIAIQSEVSTPFAPASLTP
ncbi:hypothetical protein N9Z14_08195 [Opitutales bacterium]|nr:hypothetical protein [Opitutales bacterium]